MTASRMPLPRHYCGTGTPARAGQLWRCYCGEGWRVTTVNDVFTGGPLLMWRRIRRWDLLARRRLTRQSRSTG